MLTSRYAVSVSTLRGPVDHCVANQLRLFKRYDANLIMEEQYIDVRNMKGRLESAARRFNEDAAVGNENKNLVKRFLGDAALGKTVIGKAKKKIGPARMLGYLVQLYSLILFVGKSLEDFSQKEMEAFIEPLEADTIRSRLLRVEGQRHLAGGRRLSERYKVDIKITVKKVYKWLLGNSKTYPPHVEWIDTYVEPKEISALTPDEVQRMVDRSRTAKERALIQVLFDGGLPIGELLNIRLHHVELRAYDPVDTARRRFFLRVPFSKTLWRTVALPIKETTKWLGVWLEDHPARPVVRPDGTLECGEVMIPLFPVTDNAARLMVRRAEQRTLGKRVYPHLLRHTLATFWSNRLPYLTFCKRFGWTMTSKKPQRYIDRSGVDETGVARIYKSEVTDQGTFQSTILPSSIPLPVPASGALQPFSDEQPARPR